MTEQKTAAKTDNQITVLLDEPLQRGNTTINEIIIRKPTSGALRGVRLYALMEMDVDSAALVLPRVTTPALTKTEIFSLAPCDLVSLITELTSFLVPKSALTASPNS